MALPGREQGRIGVGLHFAVEFQRLYTTRVQLGLCAFLTNLADELSELVQVALSVRSDAQLPDATVKLLCSLKWILQQKHKKLQLNNSWEGAMFLCLVM